MRKIMMATAAAVCLTCAWQAAAATRPEATPETRAFASLAFGGGHSSEHSFAYGLRVDQAQDSFDGTRLPLAQVDFNRDGFADARINGVPFVQRVVLHEDEGTTGESSGGGGRSYTAVDWALALVGIAGVGYAISEVVKGKDSPDPPATAKSAASACGSACLLSTSADYGEERVDDRWLDAGTGQMGDLIAQ